MKGVILAGGTGSRLGKLTSVLNKHLVGVGGIPMIEFPILTLKKMGLEDIVIVTGAEHAGSVVQYLTKEHPEIDFTYKIQQKAGGIAQALALTRNVCEGHNLVVILGDNILEENFLKQARKFEEDKYGAKIFLKKVKLEEAKRFGCAIIDGREVSYVEEKPDKPKSDLAMTGLYMFNEKVYDIIEKLTPSTRGELEITDAIREYVKKRDCSYEFVEGFWSDAGTFESLATASDFVRKNLKIFQ